MPEDNGLNTAPEQKKRGGARPGAGRPQYEPTQSDRTTVLAMVAAGIPVERIAPCLGTRGMTKRTLYKHFRHELATGQDYIHGRAAGRLLQAVDKGEAWAICFLLKTRYGWRERDRLELTGADGAPIELNVNSEKQRLADRILGASARLGAGEDPSRPN